ncbi:hypothetical protein D3C87_1917400 [compost metagenome]
MIGARTQRLDKARSQYAPPASAPKMALIVPAKRQSGSQNALCSGSSCSSASWGMTLAMPERTNDRTNTPPFSPQRRRSSGRANGKRLT